MLQPLSETLMVSFLIKYLPLINAFPLTIPSYVLSARNTNTSSSGPLGVFWILFQRPSIRLSGMVNENVNERIAILPSAINAFFMIVICCDLRSSQNTAIRLKTEFAFVANAFEKMPNVGKKLCQNEKSVLFDITRRKSKVACKAGGEIGRVAITYHVTNLSDRSGIFLK